jgi:hypothetical protein
MNEEIKREVEKENQPDKKLRAYVIAKIRAFDRLVNYYSALKEEYMQHYSFVEEMRQEHLKNEITIIRRIRAEGVEKGIFAISNLKRTAITILTALKGLENPIILDSKHHEVGKSIDDLLFLLFNGIRKHN